MLWNKGQCLLILLPALVFAIPYGSKVDELYNNDDYDKEYENGIGEKEEVAVMGTPNFVSESKKAMVNEGDTLRLPCIVDRLEGFVLLWKKNTDIITVGSQIINKADSRIKLEEEHNGNYLVINLAEESDGGEYVCQISAYKPTELKHSVEIRVEPVIKLTPESGLLTVKEGDSATLQCDVTTGNPTPEIIWRRRERMMPNGEEEIAGSIISFDGVNRHHSGHYICSADNGFGPQPVTAEIKLDVQHKPTVEQEQTFIHTGAGDQTEVVCVVHASPHAKVTWLHNGQPIDTGNSLVNQRGNKHTLMLVDINAESFGKYTCKAKNELGEDQRTTEISARHCDKLHHVATDLTFEDIEIRLRSPNGPSYETITETSVPSYQTGIDDPPSKPSNGPSYETITETSVPSYQTVIDDPPSKPSITEEHIEEDDDDDEEEEKEVKRTSVQTTGSPDHLDQESLLFSSTGKEEVLIHSSSEPIKYDDDNNQHQSKDNEDHFVTISQENVTLASSIPTSSENIKYVYEMFNISRNGETETTLEKVNDTEASGKDFQIFMNVNIKDMNIGEVKLVNKSIEDVHFEGDSLFGEEDEMEFNNDGMKQEDDDDIGNTTEILLITNPIEDSSKSAATEFEDEDHSIGNRGKSTKEENASSASDNVNPTEDSSKNTAIVLKDEDNLIGNRENNTKEENTFSDGDNASSEATNPSSPPYQSGKAHEATIKSESQSTHASQYKLEWTAKSKSPITVFKVQYKLKNDATWKESKVAASSLEDNFYVGHHEFKNLKSAAIYEVRIASENQFGYNSYGKEFEFATKGAVYPVQSQSVSSAPSLWRSSALVVTTVLTLFVAMA